MQINPFSILLLVSGLWFLASRAHADLTIGAAISTSDAVEEISNAFTKKSGIKVRHSFAGTNIIARQIEAGAPIDVFISADTATTDALFTKKLIAKSISIAGNQLVIILPITSNRNIDSPETLLSLKRIAIADPKSVPAGIYAKTWLENESLWKQIHPKLIPLQNVRAALIAAETGNADAAITYRTDALSSKKVKVAQLISSEKTGKITYPAAIVTSSKNKQSAQAYLDFLTSPQAQNILKTHGFTPLKKPQPK